MDARGFTREPQQPFRSDRAHLEVSPDAEPGHLLIEQAGNAGKLIADQVVTAHAIVLGATANR